MYYFPLVPRLQRLYASNATANDMKWHANSVEDGIMRHPSDSLAWKHFNRIYPDFASEIRNVRLGLCTDGFQPFGQSGQQYSSWPVILTTYNLPPWMCMKADYMFLTVLVPGPKNPKEKIDVFLQPLIAELNQLWEVGVQTYDISKKQNFQMRAALLWTVSDFPAYSMLSGWSTAGRLACPYCMDKSDAFTLKHSGKQSWFDNHWKFLPANHPFRKNKTAFFKNKAITTEAPLVWSGYDILAEIETLGLKKVTKLDAAEVNRLISKTCGWKKRSIFWDLPYWSSHLVRHNLDVMYWSSHLVRHNLDVMHIEKNVFDNVFNTVMDVKNVFDNVFNTVMDVIGKTKDTYKSREELNDYCRRPELKRNLRLIPIAFRELLPLNVWKVLTELSLFFKNLTSTTIRVEEMMKLENDIPLILCKLERIFPPSFFDSMEHLPIHLAYEARIAGPVQYRWMYPFERYLRKLKNNVKNKAKVEGSISNAYLVEEASSFCSYYFEDHVSTKHRNVPRNADSSEYVVDEHKETLSIFKYSGRAFGKSKARYMTNEEFKAAQTYVLLNCSEVEPFIE
ncbi:uncharacterized protein LOC116020237 [Ipomoea triloba]|uniref:uncharacterized protein LOC116020237 n=1 Tax=Ipomoea triloba TaxID=35885 RepID=UPI00125DD6C8|nr:uncharacterized protein LOC116020237 [Ipomoea triloba]